MPVANISFNFQLSGIGDGLTRSFEIVIIVPVVAINQEREKLDEIEQVKSQIDLTVIEDGDD